MSLHTQKRLLQTIVAILCCVPLSAGLAGVLLGPTALGGAILDGPDLDSHFRYISGVFLGVGLGFVSCIPEIERKGARFRLLTAFVFLGGLARLGSLLIVGPPSWPHLVGLGLELFAVPALAFWQWRLSSAANAS